MLNKIDPEEKYGFTYPNGDDLSNSFFLKKFATGYDCGFAT